ncbi:HlyD family efflux transporter periplasmic adaptor subunit [Anaerocellum danielii]|uniref:HlyD family efflux transporter periplasmic adaptor subunit n=1 Tax=Anaerocellum danielii TaxID=1387557 RepID=UPI0005EB6348|nr:HlyD family efflux transporter periplasmic adaptor subunit [Caldicellulosiruptor danielii]
MRLKNSVFLIGFITVCIIVLIAVNLFTKNISKQHAEKIEDKNVVKVERKNLFEEITLRGVVNAKEKPIFSPTSAKVKSVLIKEGGYVKKNDLIAVLDDEKLRVEIKKKEREKQILYHDLENLYTKLKECSVYSLYDGQVTEIYVKESDIVSKGSPICKVVKTDEVYFTVAFPAWLFENIDQGQQIKVILPELEQEAMGYVRGKSSVFYTNENGFLVFDVEIALKGENLPVKTKAYCIFEHKGQKVRSLNEGVVTLEENIIKSTADGIVKSIKISRFSNITRKQLVVELLDDEILKQIENKKAQIEQISGEISECKNELRKFLIRSPLEGIISNINIVEGQLINEGEKIAVIWNPQNLVFESKISELELNRVKKGQKVILQFEMPGRIGVQETVNGTVEYIGLQPLEKVEDANISFYPIKISFKSSKFKRGIHGTAKIMALVKQNALCIPIEALREENGKYYVWVKKLNNKNTSEILKEDRIVDEYGSKASYYRNAEKRDVVVGENNKQYVEILNGLKEGEEVVLPQAYANIQK